MRRISKVGACLALLCTGTALQADPFASGWTLQPSNSVLSFQTIKNETKVELMSFTKYEGRIDENGSARITIDMDSVDSSVDLRNVRLRFLFFETFDFPIGTVSLSVPRELLADLKESRRKRITLPYTLTFAGKAQRLSAEMIVTLIDYNTVSVASAYPISVSVEEFGLLTGLQKLEDAVNVDIVPSATVSFNFAFGRNETLTEPALAQLTANNTGPQGTQGLDAAACQNRFVALSEAAQIRFESNSSDVAPISAPILETIADVIRRCPDLSVEVAGHTDSTGNPSKNRVLSEQRAQSVTSYLGTLGVNTDRLEVRGYGADIPIASNDTEIGRETNRRIEFKVRSGL